MKTNYEVIIIGAGAAGLMCAAVAAQRNRQCLIIDHNDVVGRKILISGGGRCNFTNVEVGAQNFVSQNPHFAKSALSRFEPQDFLKWIQKHSIEYYEKKLGQLFCKNSAKEIVKLLVSECNEAGVDWSLGTKIKSISKTNDVFEIETSQGIFTTESLVIATGGLSIPQIGASDFGYRIARQFGIRVIPTAPALDGFRLNSEDKQKLIELAGVSHHCEIITGEARFRENILFTHAGLSGPVALQASLYWQPKSFIEINLLPEISAIEFFQNKKIAQPNLTLKNALSEILASRLAQVFVENILGLENKALKQYVHKDWDFICSSLHCWKLYPEATVGYQKAEVTKGGVDTNELSSKTFESKKVPGLYFIGEVVDVTGWLGGYNFQWAWSSAWAAAQAV